MPSSSSSSVFLVPDFSSRFQFFLVFHYFRTKSFQAFLKDFQSRPHLLLPRSLLFFPYFKSSQLRAPMSGFSLVVVFSTFQKAVDFSKILDSHPRAGFVLFYSFDRKVFFPSDLSWVFRFYNSFSPDALVLRPLFSLVLSNHRLFQSFFLFPLFKFFSFFFKGLPKKPRIDA